MTRFFSAIGLIVLLFLFGCGSKSSVGTVSVSQEVALDDRMAPLVLEKVKEFHFDVISKGGPNLVRVDDKDHLYVSLLLNKDGNGEVFKYGSDDFKVKARKVIRRGQGPREALNPRFMGGDTDTFVIYDSVGMKYLQYDSNLNYMAEYKVKILGEYYNSGGIYLPQQKRVVDAFTKDPGIDRESRALLFSRNFYKSEDRELFEIKSPWARKTAGKLIFTISRPLHFTVSNNHYYILDKKKYRIVKMDFNGKIVKDLKIKFKPIAAPKALRKKWLQKRNPNKRLAAHMDYDEYIFPALWIVPFAQGVLIGRCLDHSPDNKGPVMADYFDKDLNFKGKLELPYFPGWNSPSNGSICAVISLHYIDRKLYFVEERGDGEHWITQWLVKSEID